MTNPNTQPIMMIGKLTEDSYPSAQAFAEALVAVLGIPIDTISVIKGATGETGPKGLRGERGPAGNNGTVVTVTTANIAITEGAKYVDFDYTEDWASNIYKIILVGTIGGPDDAFDPAVDGIVGIGTMVPISGEAGAISKVRVFFTFQAGTSGPLTAVPSTNHRLSITKVKTA